MAKTTFQGPVKSINGFQGVGTGNSVSIAAGATSLTVDSHAGRMLYHNVAGPGNDPNSANNLGASFEIYIGTTKTGSFILQVANANDTMTGNAIIVDTDTNDNAEGFMTAAASDTITLNGTTTGGLAGSIITCKAIGANRWGVQVHTGGTGDLATPFSAAVS
jgi:hypothetical protein